MDLDRKGTDQKPRVREAFKVRQPLKDAHPILPGGPMPLHVAAPTSAFTEISELYLRRAIPDARVDADDPNALRAQPDGGLGRHARVHAVTSRLPVVGSGARSDQDDVPGLECMPDLFQALPKVQFTDLFPGLLAPEVEPDPIAHAPLQGDLVNRGRWTARRRLPIMPGSVHVGPGVAIEEAELFDGVGPAAEILRLQAIALGDEAGSAAMVEIGDAGGHEKAPPVQDGQAQIHDPVHHSSHVGCQCLLESVTVYP